MEKHIPLVGILNIVYRSLLLLLSLVLVAAAFWIGRFIETMIVWGEIRPYEIPPGVMDIVPFIILVFAGLLMIVSLAGIIGGIGLMQRRPWGRIVLLVVSFFNLLHIPLGTALGVYTLWVLMSNETIRLLGPPPVPTPPPAV